MGEKTGFSRLGLSTERKRWRLGIYPHCPDRPNGRRDRGSNLVILQDLIDTDDFTITPYYSLVSVLIAFSSGLILTFITVVFSAYRASNLNIVVAIRGLKDEFVKKAPVATRIKLLDLGWNLIFPVKQLVFILTLSLIHI